MAETVRERLGNAWTQTDRIFDVLTAGAWLMRPIALRHPFVFYLGHLPAFAWNHICVGVLGEAPFNPGFDDLFSRGIDPDVDDPTRCHDHPEVPDRWPALEEVIAYRDRVRQAILDAADRVQDRAATRVMAREGRIFSMVIEHERMHQETLLYMLARLGFEHKQRPDWLPTSPSGRGQVAGQARVRAGRTRLGASIDELPFGWDNEFGAVEQYVPAFFIDGTAVTNAEFLPFVEAGGYRRPDLWQEEDWHWREQAGVECPVVWQRARSGFVYRTMFDLRPMDAVADWPVYVSLAEARAFARWQGGRLPSEAEFHRAAFGGDDQVSAGGTTSPGVLTGGNLDFKRWEPAPVGTHPAATSPWGVYDLIGDGWEWTDTVFDGHPGFQAYIPGYPGYSADFFDGKHYVLKGASWATAAELVRPSFRNWFQAHYPYVFAKFRCVNRR